MTETEDGMRVYTDSREFPEELPAVGQRIALAVSDCCVSADIVGVVSEVRETDSWPLWHVGFEDGSNAQLSSGEWEPA